MVVLRQPVASPGEPRSCLATSCPPPTFSSCRHLLSACRGAQGGVGGTLAGCALHTRLPSSSGGAVSAQCWCAMCSTFPGIQYVSRGWYAWFPGKNSPRQGSCLGVVAGRQAGSRRSAGRVDRAVAVSSLRFHFMSA